MKILQIAPMFYGAKPELFEFARKMRISPTDGEKLMWEILSEKEFSQYKFRRQHPLNKFIADFYCHRLLLVIEIDGGYHLKSDQKEFDILRDEDMKELGITVCRFTNEEIRTQREQSAIKLKGIISQLNGNS